MPITTFDPENPGAENTANTEKQVAVTHQHAPGGLGIIDDSDASGEITAEDIKFPRLSAVHKIGDLGDLFPGKSGAFALNKDGILCPPGGALDVTAVFIKKYYVEDVGFDSGLIGKRANTAMEVLEKGGSIMKGDENYYGPVADILLLIKEPKELNPVFDGMFFYDIDNAAHLLAIFSVRTTAYNGVAMPLLTLKKERGSIRVSQWKLSTVLKNYQSKSWHQPILRPAGVTSPAYLDFMKGLAL